MWFYTEGYEMKKFRQNMMNVVGLVVFTTAMIFNGNKLLAQDEVKQDAEPKAKSGMIAYSNIKGLKEIIEKTQSKFYKENLRVSDKLAEKGVVLADDKDATHLTDQAQQALESGSEVYAFMHGVIPASTNEKKMLSNIFFYMAFNEISERIQAKGGNLTLADMRDIMIIRDNHLGSFYDLGRSVSNTEYYYRNKAGVKAYEKNYKELQRQMATQNRSFLEIVSSNNKLAFEKDDFGVIYYGDMAIVSNVPDQLKL